MVIYKEKHSSSMDDEENSSKDLSQTTEKHPEIERLITRAIFV
jgi:hypothetical protein